MTRFIQLHLLVSYPPANLNRDVLGRPKTAKMGGVDRLRVSSQSLKRAWRTSELFQDALAGHIGTRTKLLGQLAHEAFVKAGLKEKDADTWASKIGLTYGELKTEKAKKYQNETLVHLSPEELASFDQLVLTISSKKREPTAEELDGLLHIQHAVDLALFGRMLAGKAAHNTEAAVQVAHAIGVHASAVEDDYFTAVDDLNKGRDETGAGHVGEAGFAAAVFYEYVCIDRDQLLKNLGGDEALVQRTLRALTNTALTVGPSGKQNSFASRAYVHYALAEKGPQQPRSLALAFLKPIDDKQVGYGEAATKALAELRANMDKVYGNCADAKVEFNVLAGTGSKAALVDFVAGD
ncbi:MAG: type I-E CRISPR-associated protein Cas7/Cse4/CasC [Rhodocyclaceae bacterium]|nr:type I-E CRISPR-associated protein Cas7/Cse4/CasC [Rhodocyclaceae bacterium]